jgi:hypothetical protein
MNQAMEWDVYLSSIPMEKEPQGMEVTVNFLSQLDNQNTFYTDSNGLEMQKRVLNFRPTWDFTSEVNITGTITLCRLPQ